MAATLMTFDVHPVVKMAKELKARSTKGKESGDEYLYACWLQRLIVDSVSFDGFLAAVKKKGRRLRFRIRRRPVWTFFCRGMAKLASGLRGRAVRGAVPQVVGVDQN